LAGIGGSWKISGSDCDGCDGGASDTGNPAAVALLGAEVGWPSTASPIAWNLSSLDMSFLEARLELAIALSV